MIAIQYPSWATFHIEPAARNQSDLLIPQGKGDSPNPGMQVLAVNVPPGNQTLAVIFVPKFHEASLSKPPPELVPLDEWTLYSH